LERDATKRGQIKNVLETSQASNTIPYQVAKTKIDTNIARVQENPKTENELTQELGGVKAEIQMRENELKPLEDERKGLVQKRIEEEEKLAQAQEEYEKIGKTLAIIKQEEQVITDGSGKIIKKIKPAFTTEISNARKLIYEDGNANALIQ